MAELEFDTVAVAAILAVAALALPIISIALHQRKRRAFERSAGLRRKQKIRL